MSKGTPVDIAALSCELQDAREKSSQDGHWRIFLTPNDPIGKMLKDTIEACSGAGRTEVFPNGGKVSVTSDTEPFGSHNAILIPVGRWVGSDAFDVLKAWETHCRGAQARNR